MPLQLRRGNTAEVGSITPSIGELVYDTQLKRVNVGDGSTAGGVPIAGVTTNEAKDAAAASLLAGTHQNISFTYNSTTKALSAAVDIQISDTIETDAIITGKIFNSSSTVVVDVATSTFNGNLTGNVTGNVTGTHSGNVVTNLISSSDSSPIVFDTPTQFQTNIIVDDTVTVNSDISAQKLTMETTDSSLNILSIGQHHDDSVDFSAGLSLRRSRNTSTSPTVVQAGDQLFKTLYSGFDGTNYTPAVALRAYVDPDGTVSPGAVPGFFSISTYGNDGIERPRLEFDSIGRNTFYGITQFITQTTNGLAFVIQNSVNSGADGARLLLRRTRGSVDSPTAVVSGDAIYRIGFSAYDGTAFRDSAFIKATVDDTVSTGVVPIGITIQTSNSSGTTVDAIKITKDQELKVNKIETLNTESVNFQSTLQLKSFADSTARDSAVTSPAGGMLCYITATNKFQGYVAGTGWVDLN
jgi:hypothetical protein